MRRALFFLVCFACGPSEPAPQHVEIAQPLPTVSATATASATVTARAMPAETDDKRNLRRVQVRSPALVRTEVQALESLLAATNASSPDRPALLRRLAEDYVELRKGADAAAGAKAIKHYSELAKTYPSYAQIDEVWYYLGFEYEQVGDNMNARKSYYELIKGAPSSKYVPYAYYAFGEIFFNEAKGDASKFEFAKQAFMETMKFGSSPIARPAECRLAQVYDALGDAQHATTLRARGVPCGG